jgi:DNA repair exonuclease SbcCD ATPase subunit
MSPGDRAARIKELEGTISAYEMEIRMIRSDRENPEGFERRRKDLQRTLEVIQSQLEAMDNRFNNAFHLMADYKEKITDARESIKLLRNAEGVGKALRLAAELQAAFDSMDPEQCAALLASGALSPLAPKIASG